MRLPCPPWPRGYSGIVAWGSWQRVGVMALRDRQGCLVLPVAGVCVVAARCPRVISRVWGDVSVSTG